MFKNDKDVSQGKGENDVEWITVNGTHIPIKNGETRNEAVEKKFKEFENEDGLDFFKTAIEAEPTITKDMVRIANEGKINLVGLENRIKSKESYNRKKVYGDSKQTKDVIRYTATCGVEDYTEKVRSFIDKLKENGYTTIVVKSTWKDGAVYKGINTFIESPNGQIFEMQYHTEESFKLKHGELHKLYEKQRILEKNSKKASALKIQMAQLSSKLANPNNIEEIKSYEN